MKQTNSKIQQSHLFKDNYTKKYKHWTFFRHKINYNCHNQRIVTFFDKYDRVWLAIFCENKLDLTILIKEFKKFNCKVWSDLSQNLSNFDYYDYDWHCYSLVVYLLSHLPLQKYKYEFPILAYKRENNWIFAYLLLSLAVTTKYHAQANKLLAYKQELKKCFCRTHKFNRQLKNDLYVNRLDTSVQHLIEDLDQFENFVNFFNREAGEQLQLQESNLNKNFDNIEKQGESYVQSLLNYINADKIEINSPDLTNQIQVQLIHYLIICNLESATEYYINSNSTLKKRLISYTKINQDASNKYWINNFHHTIFDKYVTSYFQDFATIFDQPNHLYSRLQQQLVTQLDNCHYINKQLSVNSFNSYLMSNAHLSLSWMTNIKHRLCKAHLVNSSFLFHLPEMKLYDSIFGLNIVDHQGSHMAFKLANDPYKPELITVVWKKFKYSHDKLAVSSIIKQIIDEFKDKKLLKNQHKINNLKKLLGNTCHPLLSEKYQSIRNDIVQFISILSGSTSFAKLPFQFINEMESFLNDRLAFICKQYGLPKLRVQITELILFLQLIAIYQLSPNLAYQLIKINCSLNNKFHIFAYRWLLSLCQDLLALYDRYQIKCLIPPLLMIEEVANFINLKEVEYNPANTSDIFSILNQFFCCQEFNLEDQKSQYLLNKFFYILITKRNQLFTTKNCQASLKKFFLRNKDYLQNQIYQYNYGINFAQIASKVEKEFSYSTENHQQLIWELYDLLHGSYKLQNLTSSEINKKLDYRTIKCQHDEVYNLQLFNLLKNCTTNNQLSCSNTCRYSLNLSKFTGLLERSMNTVFYFQLPVELPFPLTPLKHNSSFSFLPYRDSPRSLKINQDYQMLASNKYS